MAVMSARKRAIGNTWKYKNEQKEVTAKQEEVKPISEHIPALNEDLWEIVNYMWKDEQINFEECGEPTQNHIFLNLRRIRAWLEYGN